MDVQFVVSFSSLLAMRMMMMMMTYGHSASLTEENYDLSK